MDETIKDLIQNILQSEPGARLNIDEILNHKFLKKKYEKEFGVGTKKKTRPKKEFEEIAENE